MFYATWSKGFRPGGVNRRVDVPPYAADFLINYELGWKTTFGPLRWNGDIFHEKWKAFQFAFLGLNSFTEIHNAKDANINGLETDLSYIRGGLTLNAAAAYTDAKTKGNICTLAGDPDPACLGTVDGVKDFPSAPSGTRLPITPKFKATATARYSWPAWADVKAHVQAGVSYQGSAPSSIRTRILLAQVPATAGDAIVFCTAAGALNPDGVTCNPNLFQGKLHAATLV